MANNNKTMVDLPFFELCNQAPVNTSAVSAMTTAEMGDNRFIYYISTSSFYRYDTYSDTWQQLATPPIAPVTFASLRMTTYRGYHGRILSATSTTVTIPALPDGVFGGETLQILSGTGMGQSKTLTYLYDTIHDAGVITGTTTSTLADSTKKWKTNQWAGYMVGITFGTDVTQYKKILYNDATTLYVYDANLQPHDPWNNQYFVAASPYALPVTTAGSQAHYQITSSTYSVSSWATTPNYTSFFTTKSGGIYLLSSAAAAPFFTLQYYDILADSWQIKTCPQSLILAAMGTDAAIERIGKIGSAYASNSGTISATSRTLSDSTKSITPGAYDNYRIVITGGTGAGQYKRIVASAGTTFTVPNNWDINPSSDSTYEVWPNYDMMYVGGNASSALYAYSIMNDSWLQGNHFDDGVVANISCTLPGWIPIAVSTGVRIAAGVQAVSSTPTAGGTNYVIGDRLTCSVGGTGAQVIVTSISAGGIVTGIELIHSGTATGFTTGTGKATSGGSGTGCTINITQVGPTALITTASAHWFYNGATVSFAGCTESAWNTSHTIIGIDSTTSFSVIPTATANMSATSSQSTTVIVDASKNWVVNEHVGRLVHLMVAGLTPTSQIRWVISNTANTLTVATIVAGVNGTSKYVIYDSKIFGCDDTQRGKDRVGYGYATGGTTTTLVDSTKNWIPNQWVGYVFKIESGVGYGSGKISITSNTNNTLTYTTQTFSPDSTTKYEIADTWGLATAGGTTTPITEATTKNWVVNYWAGKRFRITGGTALGQEATCTSNTATALTSAALTATDATSTYAILSIPPRGAGIELIWIWGTTDVNKKGKYLFFPRGSASNTADFYDITTGKWMFSIPFIPQSELFTTGSSYAYDGENTIYMSRSAANLPIRIFGYDLTTRKVVGAMTTTILQSTAHIGNLMEIVNSPTDGYPYLYCLQNTGSLMLSLIHI